ncbi:unnamed protein product [Ixodes pacificus]
MEEKLISETMGQMSFEPLKMRDGAVCGDFAEINRPCVGTPGDTRRSERVDTVTQGTSPEADQSEDGDEDDSYLESDESLDDRSSYHAMDNYFAHKFLQDFLARMTRADGREERREGDGADRAPREPLDVALVQAYSEHAMRVYQAMIKHIDSLGTAMANKLSHVRSESAELEPARRIQVQLYADTAEASASQLRRVAMSCASCVLLDMAEPDVTVPAGLSEQYLFCRIVSACLKLRDSWWKSELYLSKHFLRFLNRCQGLSHNWQSRLQEAQVSLLRASIEVHERMDREIGLWQWARSVKFPARRPALLHPNLLNIFVDEQLTGDVSSLMTLFVFETGNTVYRAIFSIQEEFKLRQLSYDSGQLEDEVRHTWSTYLENVHEQCTNLGTNRALYTMGPGEDPARIGQGLRFYMDLVSPLHKAVTEEWARTYGSIVSHLKVALASEDGNSHGERGGDLDQVASWVNETGQQVLEAMQSAFTAFENQVRVITKNVELFSVQVRKILE